MTNQAFTTAFFMFTRTFEALRLIKMTKMSDITEASQDAAIIPHTDESGNLANEIQPARGIVIKTMTIRQCRLGNR